MHAIEVCRTSVLGGHKDKCDNCGHLEISYNSCRNRHCPKCQTLKKERWIEARGEDLLPIQYFHVVFTIPSELNHLVSMNRKVMYDLLFRSVSETLMELAHNPKHLGARIGAIGLLHTWGQNLMDHPHIHCIVTGGGLSSDGNRWVSCRKGFFIPVRVMSALFRGKFLDQLKKCFPSNDLVLSGSIRHLQDPGPSNLSGDISTTRSGSSIAKRPSMAPRGSFTTSAGIPIESPSAITASSLSGTAMFLFCGEIMPTVTAKRP